VTRKIGLLAITQVLNAIARVVSIRIVLMQLFFFFRDE